jgi:hypothetical protein
MNGPHSLTASQPHSLTASPEPSNDEKPALPSVLPPPWSIARRIVCIAMQYGVDATVAGVLTNTGPLSMYYCTSIIEGPNGFRRFMCA